MQKHLLCRLHALAITFFVLCPLLGGINWWQFAELYLMAFAGCAIMYGELDDLFRDLSTSHNS